MPDAGRQQPRAQAAHQRQLEDEPEPLRGDATPSQKLAYLLDRRRPATRSTSRFTRRSPTSAAVQTVLEADEGRRSPSAPRTATGRTRARSPARCRPAFLAKLNVTLRDRRPLRAARAVRRDRRGREPQGEGGAQPRHDADPVRRRDARGARGGRHRAPRSSGQVRGRAGQALGRAGRRPWSSPTSRSGPSAPAGRRPPRTPRRCARSIRADGGRRQRRRRRRGGADPVRRLGEARQRRRAHGASPTSTAPWSAAPASTPTSSPRSSSTASRSRESRGVVRWPGVAGVTPAFRNGYSSGRRPVHGAFQC